MTTSALTAADYRAAFETERVREYPVIDAFEAQCGYAIDRVKLETAAKVLACPVKKNPPNWQHGRVLYAAARKYLAGKPSGCWTFLDIGTAKGFSALCLQWALNDHAGGARCSGVTSIDVIDPHARVERKTVAEVDGLLTLAETLALWPEASGIRFVQSTGICWLAAHPERIHVAFVDGKHSGHVVVQEGKLLAARQHRGDLAIFDDVHIPDVSVAVNSLHHDYRLERIELLPNRHYEIGVRR